MNRLSAAIGGLLARYLTQPIRCYEPFAVTHPEHLATVLEPADVLLVEGEQRISTAIKYLTQSTWSHAALYVGTSRQAVEAWTLPCWSRPICKAA